MVILKYLTKVKYIKNRNITKQPMQLICTNKLLDTIYTQPLLEVGLASFCYIKVFSTRKIVEVSQVTKEQKKENKSFGNVQVHFQSFSSIPDLFQGPDGRKVTEPCSSSEPAELLRFELLLRNERALRLKSDLGIV